ncbi:esterase/lipase family protein [Lysinibacillus sphaericus]
MESLYFRMSSGTAGETIQGSWDPGEEPDEVKPGSYPILFIHGINTTSATWSVDGNDIRETARAKGYRTAFITLSGTADMWSNGLLLAEKLKEISGFFQKKVVIVAHSKGGIDAQTAMVYHGASQFVKRVITLSTPHHGSQLADLAFSKWADWIADTLGSRSEAVFSLQTGYMKAYRKRTDDNMEWKPSSFYTFSGTGWGSMGSELFWGGLYLRRFGASDGAVTVKSSRLPYGEEVMVGDWTHKTIKLGNEIFPYIEKLVLEEVEELPVSIAAKSIEEELPVTVLHKGGVYTGVATERFYVEDGVDELTVDWISSSTDASYVLTDPYGRRHVRFVTAGDETGFFPDALHHSIIIPSPAKGSWVMEAKNASRESYLLNVMFSGGMNVGMEEFISAKEAESDSKKMKMTGIGDVEKQIHLAHYPSGKKDHPADLKPETLAGYGEGILNITIDIKGTTAQGEQFERTIISTVAVDEHGDVHE